MQAESPVTYQLVYWPFIPGRGEYVRLLFEATGTPYVDVARLPEDAGGGTAAIKRYLSGEEPGALPLAPPILRAGERVIAQTANICQFLAPRLYLVPEAESERLWAHQLMLTIADLVAETHDTHHPLGVSLYYEDQREAARERGRLFREERLPKFLGYFERVIERNDHSSHALGSTLSTVDLALFHTLRGLRYAFPHRFAHVIGSLPRLAALHEHVAALPSVAAYLESPRCLPFNEHGIFRHYPELDPPD